MDPIRFTILGKCASKANSRKVADVGPADARRRIFIKSKDALQFERDALRQIPPAARARIAVPVRVSIWIFYESERPDLDESLVLDILQDRYKGTGDDRRLIQSGVIRNDRLVREKHVYHGIDRANPRVEVKVELLQAMQANLDQGKVRNAIAFDEHSDGGCSVHPERLVHDEREALDRVCAWIESESAAAK